MTKTRYALCGVSTRGIYHFALPLTFDPANATFRKLLDYAACLARHGEGRYLVAHIDAHSNADTLSALRGPERFMMVHQARIARAIVGAALHRPMDRRRRLDLGQRLPTIRLGLVKIDAHVKMPC